MRNFPGKNVIKATIAKAVEIGVGIPPRHKRNQEGDPDVLHVGRRAYVRRVTIEEVPHIKKTFARTRPGRTCFANETMANELFRDFPWMSRWNTHGRRWFTRPMYPFEARLDQAVTGVDKSGRVKLAAEALAIILDMYSRGFAHRDFHARNLYYINGQLKLTDFETMVAYPPCSIPPFSTSYDITGRGLESPYYTRKMGFASDHPASLLKVLQVSFDDVMDRLHSQQRDSQLKKSLRQASLTFSTGGANRHTCKAARIYSSFSLPKFRVEQHEGQRNCARRLEQFGVTEDTFAGKRIVDLGSNIGGVLFELQKFNPQECLGVEYDADKVAVARRVAALNNLDNVMFINGNIDKLTVDAVRGPCDVVMCLAVEAHVKKPRRLYSLLGQLTTDTLLFEGNSSTDYREAQRQLTAAGFRKVEYLGVCDDDCVADNNCRPLLRAWK